MSELTSPYNYNLKFPENDFNVILDLLLRYRFESYTSLFVIINNRYFYNNLIFEQIYNEYYFDTFFNRNLRIRVK